MVSASKAAREAKKAAEGKTTKKPISSRSKLGSKKASSGDGAPTALDKDGNPLPDDQQSGNSSKKNDEISRLANQMDKQGLSDRVTTGVLSSLKQSRDVKITSVSLVFHGRVLITDTVMELTYGRRYGLLGENGCGKSTLLKAIDKREFPIPEHVDIYLLNEGAPPGELGALEWVVKEAENEMERLDKQAEEILENEGPESPLLMDLYERMENMDPSTFSTRASLILTGLGFNKKTILKKTKDMSGGWRMRVALAKALFVKPSLLLLDDPTAHLDLEACVWLEEYLKKWDRTLVLVSHSMDFLNGVCTNMIDMRQKNLIYYGGNYDTYHKTRSEQEVNQMKAYQKQQDEIAHIKKFIASAGTYANLVRQAKSRQKILDKMEADGFIQKVEEDRVFTFRFADVEKLPPPVLSFDDVTFSYSGDPKDDLYRHLDLGVDMDSRTALVGPNGVGKSTLLRLMTGKLSPTSGTVSRHTHLKMGVYSQHSSEQLDLTKSALDFVRDKYASKSQDYQYWRQQLGKYGLSGDAQTALMGTLSEGQKSRIVFALLAIDGPNMLLLDEPTNGLDIPTIDSLADAINAFTGGKLVFFFSIQGNKDPKNLLIGYSGVVVVSHDFRLLDKIAKDIMVCENQTIRRWSGSIVDYKNHLRKKMMAAGAV
ncbi:ABC transporter ATP-binding protein ARB1 [Golovinomyces cichoracearum]|uniref:ABC transporter ATP-binding protein ARB1 n=1 Tax=Golovinomyces cichoracearum TaxID=62708 RepID=A0A420IEX6_9PEZI|nr:ABC transporter ATP-binding protein ARB1 [Golovinomyces cichoracearum]